MTEQTTNGNSKKKRVPLDESPLYNAESGAIVPQVQQPTTTASGLTIYQPPSDLDELLDFVQELDEQTELDVMVIDHNLTQTQQEGEVLGEVVDRLSTIQKKRKKIQQGQAQLSAQQQFNEMLRNQALNLKKQTGKGSGES